MKLAYHSFGMIMPGRSNSTGTYRFGFNGKENDNEVKGSANQQDYGMRIYDARLGRFLSVDPLSKKFPQLTPYQFASNTPIIAIDLDGLEAVAVNPNTKNLVIVIQGLASLQDDKTSAQHTLVDNIQVKDKVKSIRDQALGSLETIIPQKGSSTQVITYTSSLDESTPNDVLSTIYNFKKNNPDGKVVLVGHSLGAINANEAARNLSLYGEGSELKNNKKIDLLITLDPASPKNDGKVDLNVPSNVVNAINLNVDTKGGFMNPSGGILSADNEGTTHVLNKSYKGVDHRNIDNTMVKPIANLVGSFLSNGVNPLKTANQINHVPVKENDGSGSCGGN